MSYDYDNEKRVTEGCKRETSRQSLKPLSELSLTMESGTLFHESKTEWRNEDCDGVSKGMDGRERHYSCVMKLDESGAEILKVG